MDLREQEEIRDMMFDVLGLIPRSHMSTRELVLAVDGLIHSLRGQIRDWERHECECDCDTDDSDDIRYELRGIINALEDLI